MPNILADQATSPIVSMEYVQQLVDKATNKKNPKEEQRDNVLNALAELGGFNVTDDSLIFSGSKFIIPEQYEGNVESAEQFLREWRVAQNKQTSFSRTFNFRPWDGAAAFDRAMKRVFGTSGLGKTQMSMFGPIPPQQVSIAISAHENIQVPWGAVSFPPLDATFYLDDTGSEDFGQIFLINVEGPLKYRRHFEGFFDIVEEELRERSIYRGKAFSGSVSPTFMDIDTIDPSRVVYNEEVKHQLDVNMWSLIRYSQTMRENRIPLKRSVLVYGKYGCGKSLAGELTAKEAVENGWTFVKARPGKDNLNDILKMAQLYAPAVVWFEDIDVVAKGENDKQISQLLDSLDGITNKGVEILAGFTTNFVEKIQKGVLRPGRLDAVIPIGELSPEDIQRLCRVIIPENIQGNIDYAPVAEAFKGMVPAFIKEGIDRAMRYTIARNGGQPGLINTEDLVDAAKGLNPQLVLMDKAQEGVKTPMLETAFGNTIDKFLDGRRITDGGGINLKVAPLANGVR